MTTSTESKINLILDKPSDWIQWFFIIQDTAKTNKVWQYVDPSKKKGELPKLEPPNRPTPRDVLPTATSIAQLDQNQFAVYSQLYAEYKDDLRIHQKQEQAINNISNYIVRSTSVAYLPLTDGLDTVHERLQALKTALAPTTSGRKHEVAHSILPHCKAYNIATGSTSVGVGRFGSSSFGSSSFLNGSIYCHTLLVLAVS